MSYTSINYFFKRKNSQQCLNSQEVHWGCGIPTDAAGRASGDPGVMRSASLLPKSLGPSAARSRVPCLEPGPAHRFAGKVLGGGAAAATEQGLCPPPPPPEPPLTLRSSALSRPQARRHWRKFCRPQGAHRMLRGCEQPTRLSHWDLNLLPLPRLPCRLASLQLAILILDVQPDSACSAGPAFEGPPPGHHAPPREDTAPPLGLSSPKTPLAWGSVLG